MFQVQTVDELLNEKDGVSEEEEKSEPMQDGVRSLQVKRDP